MYFDDLIIGMTVNTPEVLIKREKMLAFAREYDSIPLHTDEDVTEAIVKCKPV